jgi:hypothetical protein
VIHYPGEGVWYAEYKTGGELTSLAASIHKTGSVRDELAVEHDVTRGMVELFTLRRVSFSVRNMINNSFDNIGPFFQGSPLRTFSCVAFTNDFASVDTERPIGCSTINRRMLGCDAHE